MIERTNLFRPEVLEARRTRANGEIRLAQPISSTLIALVALALGAALISFVAFGSVTKKARVAGVTLPVSGSLGITAPSTAVLVRSKVKEGQWVEEGAVLFELSTEKQGVDGELTVLVAQQLEVRRQSLAAERRLRIHQDDEKRRELDEKLRNQAAETRQLEQDIELAGRRQELARAALRQYETLQKDGFVSAAQMRQKQDELLDASARLGSLQRNKLQLDSARLSLRAERDGLETRLATDLTQIDSSLASVEQQIAENAIRKTSVVVAPKAGTVTAIGFEPGQTVNQSQTIATLIPSARAGAAAPELEVQLFVPTRMAGFIAAGQDVLIRYKAFPYQMYGLQTGRIVDVSTTPFTTAELPASLAASISSDLQQGGQGYNGREGLYRVRVQIARQSIAAEGRERALRPGMTLEADIVQDKRRIWEWIIRPAWATVTRA